LIEFIGANIKFVSGAGTPKKNC